jgi:RNA polymerase sigma factor (sigma-70 family)
VVSAKEFDVTDLTTMIACCEQNVELLSGYIAENRILQLKMAVLSSIGPKTLQDWLYGETGDTIKPYVEGETVGQGLALSELENYTLKKTLSVVMDELPKTMRLILVLKYFEDLNFHEISSVVNLSEGRICQLHAEALDMLKEFLENQKVDILAA